jgi:hypothetical protein
LILLASCGTAKQAAEKGMFAIAESEKLPSGAKAPLIPGGLSARLKSGPVTKPVWREFFRSL